MADGEGKKQVDAARDIAALISDFRKEVVDKIMNAIEDEADEVESQGFDPAKGRGRGPRWVTGE